MERYKNLKIKIVIFNFLPDFIIEIAYRMYLFIGPINTTNLFNNFYNIKSIFLLVQKAQK